MSQSIGSSEARDAWVTSLTKLRRGLNEVHSEASIVPDEESFRDKFIALPEDHHIDNPSANFATFSRHHDHIHLIARSIDDAVGLRESPTLKEVFWSIALAAVEVYNRPLSRVLILTIQGCLRPRIRL